jgi:hypothetical protein
MLIGSGLQALATSGKFKPVDFGQIRTAGDTFPSVLIERSGSNTMSFPKQSVDTPAFGAWLTALAD